MVKKIIGITILASVFLFVGCSSSEGRIELDNNGIQDEPIMCSGNCSTEWQRAQIWMGKHAPTGITVSTDALIQSRKGKSNASYAVTKEPYGNNKSKIEISKYFSSGNSWPSPHPEGRAFYYYLKTGKDLISLGTFKPYMQ